ncbi:hypothetical protein KEM56_005128, partial [Ascosphaera pollenicola]
MARSFNRCSWTRASKLSLPLSSSLPALTTFLPLILTALTPLISLLQKQQSSQSPPRQGHAPSLLSVLLPSLSTILTFLDQLLTALPAILVALSATYFTPDSVGTCRLDNQWQTFWRSKDGDAIRGIEERLQCCGYRSVHDRAWPFPGTSEAKGNGDCVSVLGYNKACMGPWAKEEKGAAVGVFVAAVLGFVLKCILSSRQFGSSGQVRRGNLRGPTFPARAIASRTSPAAITAPGDNAAPGTVAGGGATAAAGAPAESEDNFEGQRYRDNADEEEQLQSAGQAEGRQGDRIPSASSHSHENPEEHDILHGGF